jgi:NitT/TauT family transport system ATP-binding protein
MPSVQQQSDPQVACSAEMDKVMIELRCGELLRSPGDGHVINVVDSAISLSRGEIIAVAGASGIGKTVFLLALMNKIRNENLVRSRNCDKHTIRYVPQDNFLFPDCSLRMNFKIKAGFLRAGRALFMRVPNYFQDFIQRNWTLSPRKLSGGQRRVAAAIFAIEGEPDFLLLDETFASMDKRLRMQLFEYVRKQVQEGIVGCVVVISHDDDIVTLADKVVRVSFDHGERICGLEPRSDLIPRRAIAIDSSEACRATDRSSGILHPWRLVFDLFVANCFAFGVSTFILLFPALISPRGRRFFMPSIDELSTSFLNLWPRMVVNIFDGWCLAFVATVLAIFGSIVFVLAVTSLRESTARMMILACIAAQGVPTLVLARSLQVQLGFSTSVTQILIAMTFLQFPLSVTWARVTRSVPINVIWVAGAPGRFQQFFLSFWWSIGAIGKTFVSCSPLAAIGVVVSGYIAGEKGLGYDLFLAIANNKSVAEKWLYTECCVALSCAVMATSVVLLSLVVPRDVECS